MHDGKSRDSIMRHVLQIYNGITEINAPGYTVNKHRNISNLYAKCDE